MKRYKVTYTSTDNDCCSVWTEAESVDEAKSNVMDEYWDIKEIISVSIIR